MTLFTKHTLIWLLLLGAIFTYLWLSHFKDKLHINNIVALLLAIMHVFVGVLSVKAFAIIEGFGDLSVVGNMSLFGAIFFMPAFYFLVARLLKKNSFEVFDIFTECLVFTLFCARINCILTGCCTGSLIPHTSMLWPTRELELLFYVIFLIVAGKQVWQGKSEGMIYPTYMISYSVFRFLTEFLRYSSKTLGVFHIAHVWALITFFLGLSIYFEFRKVRR